MRIGKIPSIVFLSCSLLCSCKTDQGDQGERTEIEIRQAEKDFEKMATEKGIAEAFGYYADSNAVIKRQNDTLIKGKEGIKNYYSADYFKTASVKWSPDFVESSQDGNIGYTYGNYTWQSKDSSGRVNKANGVFHTVWKKQKDGSWKYLGLSYPAPNCFVCSPVHPLSPSVRINKIYSLSSFTGCLISSLVQIRLMLLST